MVKHKTQDGQNNPIQYRTYRGITIPDFKCYYIYSNRFFICMTILLSCTSEYQVHQVHSWWGPEEGAGLSLKHCLLGELLPVSSVDSLPVLLSGLLSCFLCPLWTPSHPVVRTSLLLCKKVRLLALRLPAACFHFQFFLLWDVQWGDTQWPHPSGAGDYFWACPFTHNLSDLFPRDVSMCW